MKRTNQSLEVIIDRKSRQSFSSAMFKIELDIYNLYNLIIQFNMYNLNHKTKKSKNFSLKNLKNYKITKKIINKKLRWSNIYTKEPAPSSFPVNTGRSSLGLLLEAWEFEGSALYLTSLEIFFDISFISHIPSFWRSLSLGTTNILSVLISGPCLLPR